MNVGENYVQVDQGDVIHITDINVPDPTADGMVFEVTGLCNKTAPMVCTYVLELPMLQAFVEDAAAILAGADAIDLPRILMAVREAERAAR